MSTATASNIIAKYGTCNRSLARDLRVKIRVANDVLNVAWNWHVYGPHGLNPSVAMAAFTRKQAKCLPENIHPLIDSLIRGIK